MDSAAPDPPSALAAGFDAASPFPDSVLGASALEASVFGAASGFGEPEAVDASDLDADSSSAPARLRLFSLSPLKSVSYQPPPLRRKLGAETSFFSAFLPHDGHFVSGASEIFCITSV